MITAGLELVTFEFKTQPLQPEGPVGNVKAHLDRLFHAWRYRRAELFRAKVSTPNRATARNRRDRKFSNFSNRAAWLFQIT